MFLFVCTQVKLASGGWIDVPCMDDAVLVNLGDFMQRWTSDKYLATVCDKTLLVTNNLAPYIIIIRLSVTQPHRVIIPDDDITRSSRRQTSAVFIHPDADTLIECVDGSSKYQSIIAGDHTRRRIDETVTVY